MFVVIRICCLLMTFFVLSFAAAEEQDRYAVVIHMDDAVARIGFAGEDAPRYIEPMLIGRPAHRGTMIGAKQKELFAGQEAQSKRGLLKLSHLMQGNRVQNWEELQAFLYEILCKQHKINLLEHPVLLILPVDEPFEHIQRFKEMIAAVRQQQAQAQGKAIAKNTDGIACTTDALMALYETGRVTGVAVLMNAGAITVVSVYESQPMPHTMMWKDISIADVNAYLAKQLLENRKYSFRTVAELEIIDDIRSKLTYVAMDYKSDLADTKHSSEIEERYELPDGQVITIGEERLVTPECLFQPQMIGKEETGLPKILFNSVMKSDVDIRKDLYKNVVVVGEHAMYPDLAERLHFELRQLIPVRYTAKVIAPLERRYAVWIGGSMYALMKAGPIRKQLYPQSK